MKVLIRRPIHLYHFSCDQLGGCIFACSGLSCRRLYLHCSLGLLTGLYTPPPFILTMKVHEKFSNIFHKTFFYEISSCTHIY